MVAKSTGNNGSPTLDETRIRELEQTFRSQGAKGANTVVELISLISSKKSHCSKAIHATRRTLVALESIAAVENTFAKWLGQRRSDFVDALLKVLEIGEEEGEVEAAVVGGALTQVEVWKGVLMGVLKGKVGKVGMGVVEGFVRRFKDLRMEALEVVKEGVGEIAERLRMLKWCGIGVEDGLARGVKVGAKQVRKAFEAAWIAILGDQMLGVEERREVLGRITGELIPNMADPLKLADFLVGCYNDGGEVLGMVAALDGLFVLISKHGLDYPLFYQKLYAMMSVRVLFYAEGRSRFLQLVAMVLKRGGMLPGGLVAAFIKRLVRRAMVGPAEGALWCLRLALDLLYRHPNVTYLVHRSVNLFERKEGEGVVGEKRKREESGMDDPFDDEELDPQASRADESSLWELEVLEKHVSPAVSRMVTLFSKDVRDKKQLPPPGFLEDYADLKFSDTFNAEFKRRAKSSHLAYDLPGSAPGTRLLDDKLAMCIDWT